MHRPTKADALSVLFILYNVLYIAAVGILFSSNGQNRYRLEATPLICVLLALLVNTTWQRHRRNRCERRMSMRPNWTKG